MPIAPEEIPQYPDTLTFVPLMEDSNKVFAFLAIFPNGARLTVQAKYPAGIVDASHAKEFATRLVEGLLERRDEAMVRKVNWASATAAIQRLLLDFNDRRQKSMLAELQPGTPH